MERKDLEEFFSRYVVGTKISGDEIVGHCPFHDDKKRSFAASLVTGLWKCFAESCPARQGNLIQFIIFLNQSSFSEAIKFLKKHFPSLSDIQKESKTHPSQQVPELETVTSWKENLLKTDSLFTFAREHMGWNKDLIKRFRLGFDGLHFTIPIFRNNKLINIRKYNPYPKKDEPKYLGIPGHNQLTIFPEENLGEKFLFLFEGEKDCLLANRIGVKGITFTGGAGAYDLSFNKYFKDKKLRIIYDNDEAGRRGAVRISAHLKGFVENIKILELPVEEKEDFSDWVLKEGGTIDQLYKIEKEFPFYREQEERDKEINVIEFSIASNQEYYFKRISTRATLVGRDLAPYLIPKKAEVSCTLTGSGRKCYNCELGRKGGICNLDFQSDDPLLLSLIDVTDLQLRRAIKERLGIYTFCNDFHIEVLKAQNLIRLKLMPEVSYSSKFTEYTLREGFFLGSNIPTNQTYQFLGITLPNPKNQYATHLFWDGQPIETSLDKFKMTSEIVEKLKIFQRKEGETIENRLSIIHKDLSANVTKIYGRDDLLTAFDLIYHSVSQFKFKNKIINKGWLEALILGDTKTGKTETAISLIEHYRLGDIASGEASSLVGLLGGLQQIQQRWNLTWGKIPLNDRKLLVVDETSGLTIEQIAALSEVRSSGIAEITKIQTEKTFARTRLIWLSNPRKSSPLSYYSSGIEAVRDLIGRPEDISRFDYILTLGENEVSSEIMNEQGRKEIPVIYTTDLCHYLILWVWTRRVRDVIFEEGIEDYLLREAVKMSKEYSSEFPLVTGAEQRIKLAKMSIAIACRLFSTDEKGEKVIVKKEHVDFVLKYLDEIYSKSSFAYKLWSTPRKEIMDQREEDQILLVLQEMGRGFLDFLLHTNQLRLKDIEEVSGWDREKAKEFLTLLLKTGALQKHFTYYRKIPVFIEFLKRNRNEISKEGLSLL